MPESVNGWRWERHRIKVKGGNRGRENQRTAVNPDRPQQDHNGKDFNPSAQWQDCPGCEKCNSNGGLVLKKGSWRPTRAHEYVLQFAKSNQYYCDMDAVKEKRVFPAGTLAARGGQSRAETTGVNSRPSEYAEYSGKRNLRDVWVINPQPFKGAHYATFPEALVEPMIKVSTSQKGVCPKCGNQWARIVDSKQIKRERPADRTDRHNQENGVNSCGNTVAGVETKTLGWKATCQCGFKETVPAVILDCFAGSGRTCAVAAKLGRNYIGIELNEKYIKDFAVPQTQQAETGVTVEEARAGQRGLFEELSNHEDTKTRKNIEVKK